MNESCMKMNACCTVHTSDWDHGGGPTQEWAQALTRVNDRKGALARALLIIRWCFPSPVCLPRKALWLPARFCNDELHLTVITQPCSHRKSECCIYKSGPSETTPFKALKHWMLCERPIAVYIYLCTLGIGRLIVPPGSRRPVARPPCPGWHMEMKVPLVCHLLLLTASSVWCVSMRVFTHPAALSIPTTLPKRRPGPYLICTHQRNLGPGWQAHFPHSAWSSAAVTSRTNQAPRVVL